MPRISQLPSLTSPDAADEIAIVDASAAATKKITRTDFLKGAALPADTVTTASIADEAVTADKLDSTILAFGNYSTTEVDTGFKWIDGKSIYKRTVDFGTLPNNTYKAVSHGITSIDRFVAVDTIVSDASGSAHALNSAFGHTAARESIYITKTLIGIDTTSDRSALSAHVTMWYTKTT